ncbi:uncharacterized protein [Nicotiana sylvestris]|uniref:uncharacterized protein n=1 Tax=Nicotiana sylvestris TaxID=4096 RepID=UPI00388CB18B
MNSIIWNVRSVKTKKAFERLINMNRQHHFHFIGIMEPKQKARKLEWYKRKIGMLQAFGNISNKIWVFVDKDHIVEVLINMEQQMTMKITNMNTQLSVIVTFVYAKRNLIERRELWDSMLQGSIYTWWNGHAGDDCIFKRLDRCLANAEFQQMFPALEITHLSKVGSGHNPMLLKCREDVAPVKKAFRFLNFWTKHPTFKAVVKDNWRVDFAGDPFILFNHKLKKLKKVLSTWSRATYGDIFQKIATLEEVEFWKQKSGMIWFQDGDRSTRFFHAQVNGRRKRLQLKRIQNEAGIWLEEEAEMAEEAVRFYQAQFHEESVPSSFDILQHIPTMVDSGKNIELVQQPTKEEIKSAVYRLNGESAGGTDGFNGVEEDEIWRKIYKAGVWFVSNNWYSILLNGQPHGFFRSTRGVKQGDPLSSALFILAEEALSRELNSLHNNLYFYGFGLPKWSPKINHLAYADDIIILSSSDATSLQLIMQILSSYKAASGQLINKSKFVVYMHHSTSAQVIDKVQRITGIPKQEFPFTYLGCPIFYLRRKMDYYKDLITKWAHQIDTGHLRTTYDCHVKREMWASDHYMIWLLLCSINFGGISEQNQPSGAISCAKNTARNSNPIIVPWRGGSHVWIKMLECRDIIEHQILWQLKMGSSLFWYENWTRLGALYFVTPSDFVGDEEVQNIYDVVIEGQWNEERIRGILPEDLATHILENIQPPSRNDMIDKPVWMLETRGEFSVKGNPGRSSVGFVLRNEDGDVVYACGKEIQEGSNSVAEARAILEALKYCVGNGYVLIELNTDSMMLKI